MRALQDEGSQTPTSSALRESVKRMERSVGEYRAPDQPFICVYFGVAR